MTAKERETLIESPVTLNGRTAIISGRLEPFAMVRALDGSASAEFSWSAVARVVANGGLFRT